MTTLTSPKTLSFTELRLEELYQMMALRMAVFCVEQDCVYQDFDFEDQNSLHVIIKLEECIVAYARILSDSDHCSIGRVIVDKKVRNKGVATTLMKHCIKECEMQFSNKDIIISAQSYLKAFYYDLGFESLKQFYLEDDIPHEKMIYRTQLG